MIKTRTILEQARLESRTFLTELESKLILSEVGIPIVETKLAITREEAVSISQSMGFPLVLKIVSKHGIHKSDVGGVKLNLTTTREIESAYEDIIASIKEKLSQPVIDGVSVQKMAKPGIEVMIGMTKDSQFWPVIMFGLAESW